MTKWVRNLIGVLMGFALLSALWSTALARVSEHQTAVNFLTDVGTELINPLLIANGSGLAQGGYQQLEQAAVAHPSQPLQIGFIKAPVLGQEIAGKDFADGTRVIYSHMAEVFYANGPQAAFSLPPQLQSIVDTYSPFVASKNAVTNAAPKLPIPQIPSFVAPFFTHIGISPTTLTADGHNVYQTEMYVFWIATLILGVILALTARGWDRLRRVAWPVFHASWFIALVGLIGTVLVSLHPTQAAPYHDILGIVGGAFFTVFYIATVVGIVGVVASYVGPHVMPSLSPGHDAAPARAPRPDSGKPQTYAPIRSGTTLPNDNRGNADRAPYRYKDAPSFPRANPGYRSATGPAQPGATPGGDRWSSPRQDFPPSQARWPSLDQDASRQQGYAPGQDPWSYPQQGNQSPQDPWMTQQQSYPPPDPWMNPAQGYPPSQDAWSDPQSGYPAPQSSWMNSPQVNQPPPESWMNSPQQGYPPAQDQWSGQAQNLPVPPDNQPDPRRYRQAPSPRPDGPDNYPPTRDPWANSR